MIKRYMYILFLVSVGFACEEVYHADIDDVESLIAIEALVTNEADQNFVRISKTKGFYEDDPPQMVSGVSVELVTEDGQSFAGIESSSGYFELPHEAIAGTKYKLVITAEGDTYESDFETMPPMPAFDSLYVNAENITEYTISSFGEPIAHTIYGMRAYLDLPVTDLLDRYRFSITKTLEYIIPPPDMMPVPPTVYGWTNYGESGTFNIKGPSKYGDETVLKKHSLLFATNRIDNFLTQEQLDSDAYMVGWVVHVKQYGVSEKTYNFYEAMNEQLEAEGKLFDPVYSQLVPNIHCVSNPEKKVVGFFELSSYRFSRFFMMVSRGSVTSHVHQVNEIHVIPPSDTIHAYKPPYFWEDRYSNE